MPTPATTLTSLSGREATTKPEEEEERVAAVSEDSLFNVQSTSPAFRTQSDRSVRGSFCSDAAIRTLSSPGYPKSVDAESAHLLAKSLEQQTAAVDHYDD